MKRVLALNTASNVGTLFLKIAITFVMTPVLVSNLGRYDYGLWEMVMAIIGYMGILDLGIRPTVSRFAAGYIATNKQNDLAELFATAFYYLLGVGLVVALALVAWGLWFSASLAPAGEDGTKYSLFLMVLAVQLLIVFPAYTAESFMEAYQEYYLKNAITVFNSVLGSVIIYRLITPENALLLLVSVNAIGLSIKYLFFTVYVYIKRRFISLSPARFSWSRLKELFTFGVKTLIQGISTRIENATDTLVIGFILGPATVPLYSIPANLVNYIRTICYNLTHVFMPYFSGLAAVGNQTDIIKTYLVGSKLTIAAMAILGVGTVLLGEDFIRLWIGGDIAENSRYIVWLLVAFTLIPLLNPYASRYLTAVDRHGIFAKWGPVVAVANLGLSLLLIGPLGIYGVALGSLLPVLVFQPYLLWFVCKALGIPVSHYLRQVILPLLLPTLAMVVALVSIKHVWPITGYGPLLFSAAASSLLFVLVAAVTSLSANERAQLKGLFIKRNTL